MASAKVEGPRERLVRAAYELFSRHGTKAVGVDRVIEQAGVAKSTLYRHFPSKDDLIVAALERREDLWTRDWLQREIERRGDTAAERLIAIFDAFGEWFHRKDFESCMFLGTLLETHSPKSLVSKDAAKRLDNIHALVAALAEEAGVEDREAFACEWQMLMSGSILIATQGDPDAAKGAREVGLLILRREGIDPSDRGAATRG